MRMWNLSFILCIALSCVTSATQMIHLFVYEGREANVSCSYEEGYESYEKYLCRDDCSNNDVLITTTETKKGRYSIHDDKEKRVFTTTISDLSLTDARKYWCGVTRTGKDIYTEVRMKVGQDTCCDRSNKVQSYETGSVSFGCPYKSQYEDNLKYICRGNQPSTCLQQAIVTSDKQQNGQFRLTDDKGSRKLTVTITNLTQGDSGSYLCGVRRNAGLDDFSAVELEVKDTCCDRSNKVQSYETGSVSFSCPYEPQYQENLKYICRGNQPSTCLQQAVVTSDKQQNGQFRLTDDKGSRQFTVTITNLTQRDSGSYLCGVRRNTGLDDFSAVELEVKEWCCVKTSKLSGIMGHQVNMQCPYPPQHRDNRKFLCKGDHRNNCTNMVMNGSRFTLQDDVSSSSFLVMITELKAGDAGTYWCGSDSQWSANNYTKIQLSVDAARFRSVLFIVPPILILMITLGIVYRYKCHKVTRAGVNMDRNKTKSAEKAAPSVCECASMHYENPDVAVEQRDSEPQRSYNHYEDIVKDQQGSVYQNLSTTEDICCN